MLGEPFWEFVGGPGTYDELQQIYKVASLGEQATNRGLNFVSQVSRKASTKMPLNAHEIGNALKRSANVAEAENVAKKLKTPAEMGLHTFDAIAPPPGFKHSAAMPFQKQVGNAFSRGAELLTGSKAKKLTRVADRLEHRAGEQFAARMHGRNFPPTSGKKLVDSGYGAHGAGYKNIGDSETRSFRPFVGAPAARASSKLRGMATAEQSLVNKARIGAGVAGAAAVGGGITLVN